MRVRHGKSAGRNPGDYRRPTCYDDTCTRAIAGARAEKMRSGRTEREFERNKKNKKRNFEIK